MIQKRALLMAFVAIGLSASSTHAAVVEENVFTVQTPNLSTPGAVGTHSFDVTLSASTNTVVLVGTAGTFGSEDSTAVTVGGNAATLLASESLANTGEANVWAVSLGSVSAGDVTVEVTYSDGSAGNANVAMIAVQLSGATLVGFDSDDDAGSAGNNPSITLADAAAGSYAFSAGSFNRAATTNTLSGITNLSVGNQGGSASAGAYAFGGQEISSLSTLSITYDTAGNAKGTNLSGVVIQTIPEPASLVLLGLGGLCLLSGRRRAA